jgi:hypothetical protein
MLTVAELRKLATQEFGEQFERATPATVRDFLDRLQVRIHEELGEGSPYVIDEEGARSFEEIYTGFFRQVLDYSPDKAIVLLWLLAFEQHFTMMEDDYFDRSLRLFGEGED